MTLFNTETATLHGAKGRANRWGKMSKKAKKAHSKMMLEAKNAKRIAIGMLNGGSIVDSNGKFVNSNRFILEAKKKKHAVL